MSVQRAKFEVTSTEFVGWVAYLDNEEMVNVSKEDYYLANIAAEMRRSYVKHPERVKIESFLMKFKNVGQVSKPKTKKSKKERTKKAKAFWCGFLGIKNKEKENGTNT